MKLFAQNGNTLNFIEYPVSDILDKAITIDAKNHMVLLVKLGLKLQFEDAAHYIYNKTLEKLYPLFEKGLKIEESAYDDLVNYATEHGNAEYTAWLLDQKNKAGVN